MSAGRRSGRLLVTAVLALLLPACAAVQAEPAPAVRPAGFDQALQDRLPEQVRARKELRVANDAAYPPASAFAADGRTIVGFEPDLAAAVGTVLGVRLVFVPTDFADSLGALERREVDAVMSAMSDTVERQARADFVDYFSTGTSIVVQRGNPHGVQQLRDLCGRTVAARRATVQVDLLQRTSASCADRPIAVHELPDNASALVELRTGRAAAVLTDHPAAVSTTTDPRTRAQFQLASRALYERARYGIAVRKADEGLREALREALSRLIGSGEYGAVLAKWGVQSGALTDSSVNVSGAA